MTLYNIENIKRMYGERVVLDIPALELQAGKIYTLVGPNGAGKTTLLHLLAFLDSPTEGDIFFHNKRTGVGGNSLLELRRRVVLVDQYPILFTAPVWKNLEFGLKVRRISKKERRRRIEEALERVGMEDFYHREAHNLSGGETKRIALARALVLKPEVLLCDEPTANVDAKHQEVILRILENSNRERGLSIIFATHYLSQANRLAHHSLVLQNGSLSNEARENVFSGKLFSQGEIFAVYRLGEGVQLRVPRSANGVVHRSTTVHLVPDLLEITAGDSRKVAENSFPGVITKTEKENSHIRVLVDVGISLQVVISRNEYEAQPVWIGQEVTVAIPDGAISLRH